MDERRSGGLPNWMTAIVMALAVVILVFVFVWTFIQIDPLLSDFIPSEEVAPTVSPTQPVSE